MALFLKSFLTISLLFVASLPAQAADDIASLTARADKGDAQAQYELGRDYHYAIGVKKDDRKALEWWRKSADQNHAKAMVLLGTCYFYGAGVDADRNEAFKWYQKAAGLTNPYGQFMLAITYEFGNGVPQDHDKAAALWKQSIGPLQQAAAKGDAEAQVAIATAYEKGWGLRKDEAESFRWYRAAAEQNSPSAAMYVAASYGQGIGVKKDPVQSAEWAAKAAEHGLGMAEYMLAWDYYKGDGVPQDNVKAYMWADIALKEDDKRGGPLMVAVAKHLTLDQLNQATKLSHDWQESHLAAAK